MHPDMNKTFSINRFARLFKKHTKEHYRNYMMSIAVLVGVMILGGSFLVYMADVAAGQKYSDIFLLYYHAAGRNNFYQLCLCRFRGKKKSYCMAGFTCIPFRKIPGGMDLFFPSFHHSIYH